jgi:SPX domain protein involved in polyphosphate accumulation
LQSLPIVFVFVFVFTSVVDMRFGRTLQNTIYPPWKDKYIDYNKLKALLHDGRSQNSPIDQDDQDDDDDWTEEDEGQFVEELVNVQLEKVHNFQSSTLQRLRDETSQCEKDLEPLGVKAKEDNVKESESLPKDEKEKTLRDVLARLDKISKETNELEKYSRINYTGFLKAAKKHDRRRGQSYRVGPLLRVRLAALPFNSEDYSPLLYRLSAMYSFVRQSLEGKDPGGISFEDNEAGADTYTAYKCMASISLKTLIYTLLTPSSLGASRKSARSQNYHSSPSTCARIQPSDIKNRRRQ